MVSPIGSQEKLSQGSDITSKNQRMSKNWRQIGKERMLWAEETCQHFVAGRNAKKREWCKIRMERGPHGPCQRLRFYPKSNQKPWRGCKQTWIIKKITLVTVRIVWREHQWIQWELVRKLPQEMRVSWTSMIAVKAEKQERLHFAPSCYLNMNPMIDP